MSCKWIVLFLHYQNMYCSNESWYVSLGFFFSNIIVIHIIHSCSPRRLYVRACAIIAVLLDEEFLSLEGVIIRLCHLVPGLNPR